MLDTGDKAPDFNLPVNGGGNLALKDLKGKTAVVYFYPKDMTPGCTTEAQDFRDRIKDFEKAGAVVVGVSKDSVKRHDNFVEKQSLPFQLISDENGTLCEDFGVWVEKNMYGRKYMGIQRATFVIDGKGVIRHVWPKVKVKGHADEVLDAVKSL
ncbi:MAG: thioredoxin-dependent thiol peroxidase [Rhodospirillales bacterium]|nr:thioredoxin-dependent thiol peroxidase [Rhodospirillales bacterium]MBO6785845.1 thioredoxin-dependent thiol peroxidase [Rhodospirillales bacterium]